jgi:RNA polymerase sigma-70 factor, ECF subfamily
MPTLDGASFEDCYRKVFPLVLAKCRRMLRGDSEATDVAQEVFVRLWKHRELVEDHAALTAWLYQTSTRLVIDRARHRALSQESLQHLSLSLSPHADGDAEEVFSIRQQLRSVLLACPRNELEAAILSRLDRMTHPEIAELVGVGERTVRRLLGRFDERLVAIKETA